MKAATTEPSTHARIHVKTVHMYEDSNFVSVHTHTTNMSFSNFLLADTFWFRKITTDPHILTHINEDKMHQEVKIYISEFISDSYEHIPVAYVTMHCMI
jgi:hypothetical protein